jgi:hypothetical protein
MPPRQLVPIIRKFAIQGHEVPSGPHSPRGPFPPELFEAPELVYDESLHGDSLHEALDDVRMFRCKCCYDVLYEDELDKHECQEDE